MGCIGGIFITGIFTLTMGNLPGAAAHLSRGSSETCEAVEPDGPITWEGFFDFQTGIPCGLVLDLLVSLDFLNAACRQENMSFHGNHGQQHQARFGPIRPWFYY